MQRSVCFTFLIAVLGFSGCQDLGDSNPELTWVAKFFSGGAQCDTSSHYAPPNIEQILNQGGILVFRTTFEEYGTCLACGCPTYARMHYALIKKEDLARAEEIGFLLKIPPE